MNTKIRKKKLYLIIIMFVGQVAFVAMSSLSFQFISKSDIFTTKIDTGSKPFFMEFFRSYA